MRGPRMQAAGVEAVVDARSLAVVGIVEVLRPYPAHLRRVSQAGAGGQDAAPDLAILTDSPDFHLRLAKKLHAHGSAGGVPDRSAGVGVEAGPGESDAANADPAAVHFPLRGARFFRSTGFPRIHRTPAGADREAVADTRRNFSKGLGSRRTIGWSSCCPAAATARSRATCRTCWTR